MRPLLRAEAIIKNGNQVLVQCDNEESFYRLPGGSIEFGETAADAIEREFIEEFDLRVEIGGLGYVSEGIIECDGIKRHDCTLLHWCSIYAQIGNYMQHKEHPEIKLTWRTHEQLKQKPLYPEGILNSLFEHDNSIIHLVVKDSKE